LGEILEARDTLNLPPDDPFSDIVDKRHAEHEADDAKLRAARQTLDIKAQEVRELKEKLDMQEQEIARHEQRRAAASAAALTAPEEASLKAMREKLAELKTSLNDRHHERNNLRRELQKAHSDIESLRQNSAASPAEKAEPDHEEELLLPQDAVDVHPVRLIEFPKGFQQALAVFPRHVARAAMIMTGRLAAGEPAAFVGALRLKQVTDVMRQRIGSDYRLFFRLHPDHLQVIDLINRKDLYRRLKTLG
jgi:chromosome segregation ATPase